MRTSRLTVGCSAILTLACAVGCSKTGIPANAHVKDLGVVQLKAQSATPIDLHDDMSFYCAAVRPEQLPQKVELVMSVAKSPDGSLRLTLDNVPTPADYHRLWLKHLEVPFHSGDLCEARVGENAWIRFTPVAETL